jgi:hypothetical protein
LAEDAEEEIGVGGGDVQTTDEAADFFIARGGAPLLTGGRKGSEIAAGAEGIEQHRGDALEFGGRGGGAFLA